MNMKEDFKPISVKPPNENPAMFRLRCVLDLQLLTIYRFLRPRLGSWNGRALDVGAGEAPWRYLMGPRVAYQGVDTQSADQFGMGRHTDIVYYNGGRLPFDDCTFDHVLCTEVLEHVPDPTAFMAEIARVLCPGGSLVMTVPWSARLHHVPHDYARYSRFGLANLLAATGFEAGNIDPRGNDFAAIANKLLVALLRLLRPRHKPALLLTLPCSLVLGPITGVFMLVAHVSMAMGLGSADDPLGYGLEAVRRPSQLPATSRMPSA